MAKQYSGPPEVVIDPSKNYKAIFKTGKGDIHVDLFQNEAPKTVNNFVFLARDGFFDGTTFHRHGMQATRDPGPGTASLEASICRPPSNVATLPRRSPGDSSITSSSR